MTVKYFAQPFANAGDVLPVPDNVDVSGGMSYPAGFNANFQRNLATDPLAQAMPRQQTNQLFLDITKAIQQLQQNGYPVWISSAMNDGTSFPYSQYARVLYTDGHVYESLVNANTATPTPGTNWAIVDYSGPTAPTQSPGTANTTIANCAFVAAALASANIPGSGGIWFANSPPTGFLECNGSSLLRASYPALFSAIGTAYGSADGTHFTIPDLRGQFLRGWDNGRGVDSGRAWASLQLDAMQGHIHQPSDGGNFLTRAGGSGSAIPSGGGEVDDAVTGGPVTDGTHGTPRIASETRPTNVAAMFVIKY